MKGSNVFSLFNCFVVSWMVEIHFRSWQWTQKSYYFGGGVSGFIFLEHHRSSHWQLGKAVRAANQVSVKISKTFALFLLNCFGKGTLRHGNLLWGYQWLCFEDFPFLRFPELDFKSMQICEGEGNLWFLWVTILWSYSRIPNF